MKGYAPKKPGKKWTEPRGSCRRSPGPRSMGKDRAGLMRLQRRGKLCQVSQVVSVMFDYLFFRQVKMFDHLIPTTQNFNSVYLIGHERCSLY